MAKITDKEIREKLAVRGPESLSDAELVSIIVQDGGAGESALELAERVLSSAGGSLSRLGGMDLRQLRMVAGLGVKRAAWLAAALELGGRLKREEAVEAQVIAGNQDVVAMFRPLLAELAHEEFWVLYLTTANRVLDRVRVSQGGVSATIVDHKLIVKRAVELLASSMVLVHNHPSGAAHPSPEDLAVTEKLRQAASLFDIAVLDHLIISREAHYSFRQEGLLNE